MSEPSYILNKRQDRGKPGASACSWATVKDTGVVVINIAAVQDQRNAIQFIHLKGKKMDNQVRSTEQMTHFTSLIS